MRRLFELLMQNPILVFILLAWVAGMIGNIVKAARKGRERAEQQRRMPRADPAPVRAPRAPDAPRRASADDVAAEMRRILGMDTPPRATGTAPRPAVPPPLPQARSRRLVEPERPPTPVRPTTQERKLEIHVDSHVGEEIGRREALTKPKAESGAIGSLGGRVHRRARRREFADRYPRTNLRQALVLSEILGPPLALRPSDPPRLQ